MATVYEKSHIFLSALVSYEWDFIWKLHMHWHAGRALNLIRCSAICLIQIEANRIKLLRSPCGKATHNALGRWILGYSLWTKQHADLPQRQKLLLWDRQIQSSSAWKPYRKSPSFFFRSSLKAEINQAKEIHMTINSNITRTKPTRLCCYLQGQRSRSGLKTLSNLRSLINKMCSVA